MHLGKPSVSPDRTKPLPQQRRRVAHRENPTRRFLSAEKITIQCATVSRGNADELRDAPRRPLTDLLLARAAEDACPREMEIPGKRTRSFDIGETLPPIINVRIVNAGDARECPVETGSIDPGRPIDHPNVGGSQKIVDLRGRVLDIRVL